VRAAAVDAIRRRGDRGNVYSTKGQPDLAIEDYDERATPWVRHHTD
jgi:hypothetical protein